MSATDKVQTKAQTKSNGKTKKARTTTVELSAEALTALANFNKAKQAEAKAKALKAEAEEALRQALGTATEGTANGLVVVKVVAGKSSHFDRKTLLKNFPEAFSATYQETEYTFIKTL